VKIPKGFAIEAVNIDFQRVNASCYLLGARFDYGGLHSLVHPQSYVAAYSLLYFGATAGADATNDYAHEFDEFNCPVKVHLIDKRRRVQISLSSTAGLYTREELETIGKQMLASLEIDEKERSSLFGRIQAARAATAKAISEMADHYKVKLSPKVFVVISPVDGSIICGQDSFSIFEPLDKIASKSPTETVASMRFDPRRWEEVVRDPQQSSTPRVLVSYRDQKEGFVHKALSANLHDQLTDEYVGDVEPGLAAATAEHTVVIWRELPMPREIEADTYRTWIRDNERLKKSVKLGNPPWKVEQHQ
jgi:hypothetical protein